MMSRLQKLFILDILKLYEAPNESFAKKKKKASLKHATFL